MFAFAVSGRWLAVGTVQPATGGATNECCEGWRTSVGLGRPGPLRPSDNRWSISLMGLFRKRTTNRPGATTSEPPPPSVGPLPAPAGSDGARPSNAHSPDGPPEKQLAWSPLIRDPLATSFVWGESTRILADEDTLEATDAWDEALRAATGHGLQFTVMAEQDGPIISDDNNARELHVDPNTGVLAAASGPSHRSFGLRGGLDLGLPDGRNMFVWNDLEPEAMALPFDGLYIGNAGTPRLEMCPFACQVGGLSLSPDASRIAWIEWRGQDLLGISAPGFVVEEDLESGRRRLLSVVDHFSGSGPVRYSADGTWLLVRSNQLIRLSDGALLELPPSAAAAWAAPLGASVLLQVVGTGEEGFRLQSLDLSTEMCDDLGPIVGDSGPEVVYVTDLDVHPTESKALAVSPNGFLDPHREGLGARGKVQVLDLEQRQLTPVTTPTVPAFARMERDQFRPRWIADRRGLEVHISDRLESKLQSTRLPEAAPAGHLVDFAMMMAQRCSSDLEPGRPGRNPARVRVEILRSLAAVSRVDPARASEVLGALRDFTFPLAMHAMGRNEPVQGIDYANRPMVWLDSGLQKLAEGDYPNYPWDEYAYVP